MASSVPLARRTSSARRAGALDVGRPEASRVGKILRDEGGELFGAVVEDQPLHFVVVDGSFLTGIFTLGNFSVPCHKWYLGLGSGEKL